MNNVSVIGLGQMGSTLARLLLDNGYHVTVWNRTGSKAESLIRRGATLARTSAAAVDASPYVIVCVHDYKASDSILATEEVASVLAGRTVIQLTTGSPQEARDSEKWIRDRGGEYLDGAIQAAPAQMGRPDTTILLSGAESTYQRSESLLKIFGGNLTYLGAAAGAASAMDLATLSYVYGAILGFFHGARISEAEGFRVDVYGDIVSKIAPSFGEFLKYEGKVIQEENFVTTESPLKISVEAVDRLVQTAQESRINTEFPRFAAGLFQKAVAAGHGEEELAALIKVLRS